ncbi:DUF116 domain-containing protein [Heliophilum fasciatum]|uniref:DUF116 domain-containing protein n=1 Tax=Heliophilum fasciatum TaxID=35700 RepID=A0A4R2RXF7_9FIRM|nr:DUF116 domain-containing protein [Heliophilum fasciatum]MCW2277207.1 hypothetical protein [Heliophilum fasciatum]TCP68158.1 hypothetical protein EDD73_10460 [Heliophilum fasciatum]
MPIRKRLFISLMIISLFTVIGLSVLGGYLLRHRDYPLNQMVVSTLMVLFIGILALIALGVGGMVLAVWREQAFPSVYRWTRMAVNLLFPLAIVLGRIFGISDDRLKSSFIEVSNTLVRARLLEGVPPEKVMIMTPHCLQKSTCPHKITLDIRNCKMCGGCHVHDLRLLADAYGVSLVVATGGTWARKLIMEQRPQAIIAVACERDLTSGIQDVDKIPVIGILNDRPEGPCCNTRVNLQRVEESIRYFLYGEEMNWPSTKELMAAAHTSSCQETCYRTEKAKRRMEVS